MKEVLDDIKKNRFMPVYLLYGPEDYLRKNCVRQLREALLPLDDMMNFTRFQGDQTDPEEVIDMGMTEPFLAQRRVILMEDTGFFRSACDRLADFFGHIPDTLIVICSEESVDKRSRLYKAAARNGRAVEFARQKEDRLAAWVISRVRSYGKEISPADAGLFVHRVGPEMGLLKNEIDKLVSYAGSRPDVTRTDIETVTAARLEDKIFEMISAIADRKQQRALDLFYDLLMLKESPVKILVLLGRYYNQLRKAKELAGRHLPAKELSSQTGIPPFTLKTALRIAETYSVADLARALQDIVQTDEAIKTGQITDRLALELLIIRLTSGKTEGIFR